MIIVRAELPDDYSHIHDIHVRAFDNSMGVPTLVTLLRSQRRYDAELALVAEIDGQVVGHVMFNPIQVYLAGDIVQMVNLSPIGVHPDFQGQGVGAKLIEIGHRRANDKGFSASILLGHPTYYPQFGYQTNCYGASSVTVDTRFTPDIVLETATPIPDDVPELVTLYRANERNVNLAIVPDENFAEWLSPNPTVECTVYRYQGQIIGYTRSNSEQVRLFLAKNPLLARVIAKHLAGDAEHITLPLHPASFSASAFSKQPTVTAWEAGMLYPIKNIPPIRDYLDHIARGGLVGRVIWSSVFDIA